MERVGFFRAKQGPKPELAPVTPVEEPRKDQAA
jgi:hypothetical protein